MKHGMMATSEQEVQNIENWLGGQLDIVTTTWNDGQWGAGAITWSDSPKLDALQRVFGDTDRQLVMHFEFQGLPKNDYSDAANGDLDHRYRALAEELVSLGMGDTVVRPSAEFNLSWSGRHPDNPSNYAEGYARMVREMVSVDGANFDFTYSPAQRPGGVEAECWPVDASSWPSGVDEPVITPTIYDDGYFPYQDGGDVTPDEETVKDAWQQETYGNKIKPWEDFAAERNTKLGGSFEWGCMGIGTPFPESSGGDNRYFVGKFLNYGRDNDWEYQTYWNGAHHTIYPRDGAGLQQSSDTFKQMVGNRLGGSDSSSGDQEDSTTGDQEESSGSKSSYGGYNKPALGTLDWHIPLNENFEAIEADIKDLERRISKFE